MGPGGFISGRDLSPGASTTALELPPLGLAKPGSGSRNAESYPNQRRRHDGRAGISPPLIIALGTSSVSQAASSSFSTWFKPLRRRLPRPPRRRADVAAVAPPHHQRRKRRQHPAADCARRPVLPWQD